VCGEYSKYIGCKLARDPWTQRCEGGKPAFSKTARCRIRSGMTINHRFSIKRYRTPTHTMAFKQKKYLSNEPLADAVKKYHDALTAANIDAPLAGERIPVGDALGRVTSEAVIAKISSPFYHSAAMIPSAPQRPDPSTSRSRRRQSRSTRAIPCRTVSTLSS
jgi:hypothetical protein